MLRTMSSVSKPLDAACEIISAHSETSKIDLSKISIQGMTQSSNDVEPGDLFIALPGEKTHGAKFLPVPWGDGFSDQDKIISNVVENKKFIPIRQI